MESIDSSIQLASSTLEWMQEPSPLIGRWWARTLEWRRKSPALVVAAITAASVAPGIHHPATYTPPTQLISEPTLIYTPPTPRHRTPISSYRLPQLCHWRYPELRALLPWIRDANSSICGRESIAARITRAASSTPWTVMINYMCSTMIHNSNSTVSLTARKSQT